MEMGMLPTISDNVMFLRLLAPIEKFQRTQQPVDGLFLEDFYATLTPDF